LDNVVIIVAIVIDANYWCLKIYFLAQV